MLLKKHLLNLMFFAFSLLLLSSCEKEKAEIKEVIRTVRYKQVFSTGGERVRSFSGVAQSGLEAKLSFKVSGTVSNVSVKVGEKVKSGQLIAEIDPKDYKLQVQQAEASLEQAKAQARNARASYDRVKGLYENKTASRQDLDQARAASESASSTVEAATKKLELSKLQLSYTKLKAPTKGSIAQVEVEKNENVQAGRTIALLTSGSEIEVKIGIPEILISQIKEGDAVQVTFDAIKGTIFSATVTEVGVASTGSTTTFPVTVRLQKSGDKLRSGMAAEVSFTFSSNDLRERVMTPSVAVAEDRNGKFAYIVQPTDDEFATVKRKEVKVGELTENGLEVFEGLSDGDLVVTAGLSKLKDGQKVRL